MKPVLYYAPDNASLVVRFVLEEIRADYEQVLIDRRTEEHRGETYRKLNPRGLIPVLADSETGAVLFETGAILLRLAELHGRLGAERTLDAERADFLKWLFFLSNTLHGEARLFYYGRRFVSEEAAEGPLHARVGERLREHFALLDRTIAACAGTWLLESGLSVCDFYLAGCLRWVSLYPAGRALDQEFLRDLPALRGHLAALQQRPSVVRSLEIEGIAGPAFLDPQRPGVSLASVS